MVPKQSLLSTPLHGIYIPAGLLVLGVAIIDKNYVPHAIGLAILLSVFKVARGSKWRMRILLSSL
jgi:cytochrome-b5 reductase